MKNVSAQVSRKLADTLRDMIEDLDELMTTAVTGVFSTMLGMEMQPASLENYSANGAPQVAGSVGFIGQLTGVVYVFTTVPFARRITATLLGLDEAEVEGDEMMHDAMGEMANMLVGQMKSRLADRGMPCVLTIPSVVRGSHFSIEAISSTERHLISFQGEGNRIFIEILLKPSDTGETEDNSQT
jgi:chemotaxis protein CheX